MKNVNAWAVLSALSFLTSELMTVSLQSDAALLEKLGVKVLYNTEAPAVDVLKKEYDSVFFAVGAYKRGELKLEGGEAQNALAFLEDYNRTNGKMAIGKNVVVIGGGNTAMDTARAAKRCDGVEHVYLVYRRTKRYMPADDEHELVLAVEDGVEFRELLAPEKLENGQLICRVMKLGELDASGRAGIVETDETVAVPADRVIAAVGEKVPTDFYEANGLQVDDRGRVKVSPTLESSVENVYVIGDGLYGPSIVVKAMAQAITAAEAICGREISGSCDIAADPVPIYAKKGILAEPGDKPESERCLGCSTVCENCVDVCPNRANISIKVPGMAKAQVIHVTTCATNAATARASVHTQVHHTLTNSRYLPKKPIWLTARTMDLPLSTKKQLLKIRFFGKETTWTKGQESSAIRPAESHRSCLCRV